MDEQVPQSNPVRAPFDTDRRANSLRAFHSYLSTVGVDDCLDDRQPWSGASRTVGLKLPFNGGFETRHLHCHPNWARKAWGPDGAFPLSLLSFTP